MAGAETGGADRVATVEAILEGVAGHPKSEELSDRRVRRMAEVAASRLRSVTVVMENLWDSHNAAAVIRSAEGLGLDEVHVVEQPTRYRRHPGILHGADRWLQIRRHSELQRCLDGLVAEGFSIAAADLGPGCVPVHELDVDRPLALVFGTEKAGLTEAARMRADLRFTIPMTGFTGSFNVSVSAAIALYDVTRRRRERLGLGGDLSLEEAISLVKAWIERDRRSKGAAARRALPTATAETGG